MDNNDILRCVKPAGKKHSSVAALFSRRSKNHRHILANFVAKANFDLVTNNITA